MELHSLVKLRKSDALHDLCGFFHAVKLGLIILLHCFEILLSVLHFSTSTPMLLAVPATIVFAASTSFALRLVRRERCVHPAKSDFLRHPRRGRCLRINEIPCIKEKRPFFKSRFTLSVKITAALFCP